MARPRKPTHLKVVSGTAQACRINKAEPKPARERPSPPSHLSDRAKTAWGEACVILDRMGVLTEADGLALEGLCEALADLRSARAALRQRGEDPSYPCETAGGGVMWRKYPEVEIIADADRRFAMWLTKFGLTPADRSRVSAQLPDASSPYDEFG